MYSVSPAGVHKVGILLGKEGKIFAQETQEEPEINHTTIEIRKNNITEENYKDKSTKATIKEIEEKIFTTPKYVKMEKKPDNNNFLPNIKGITHIEGEEKAHLHT